MGIFSLFRKADFFTTEEKDLVVNAIKVAEKRTSGEIRVYVEPRCKYVNALDRAAEVFYGLQMDKTDDKNATLIYLATKDQQLAVFGDEGIFRKTGADFWNASVGKMLQQFNRQHYASGIVQVVNEIGEALHPHFPYNNDTDKNELPDEIVFGK